MSVNIQDTAKGLSREQVQALCAQGLVNTQPPSITKSTAAILREHACTLFNAINLAIFIALLFVESYNNLTFMGVILSNLLIGVIQELRSKKTVEKLSLLHSPTTCVVRDGEIQTINSEDIVLGDVIYLRLGDQIPTDCEILTGAVEVDEQLLTGESNSIVRGVGGALLSGSFIVAGECRARVDKVGSENYITKLTLEAKKPSRISSSLMKSLRFIIRLSGAAVLPLGAVLFLRTHFQIGHIMQSAVEQTAAAMLGMIPAGLMLLTSVSLAVGVMALSRKKALVQETYAIETLARVDMLCLDKTGTLTTGDMQVKALKLTGAYDEETVERMIAAYVCAIPKDNATSRALYARFADECAHKARGITPFSSARRYSAALFEKYAIYVGAPKTICPNETALLEKASAFAGQGYRVLMLAVAPAGAGEEPPPILEAQAKPAAFVLLQDEIRGEAAKTLRFFRAEGVDIKIISGDDPITAAHIAKRLELPNSEAYLDVSALSDDEDIAAAAKSYTVFGRVSPHAKRVLCRALKEAGHTVAMTGDGVNDLLALREADCSIALFNGSDAARQAAHIVLLTNDFSLMSEIVMEGRRVINNITRTASLFLVKTIYSLLLTLGSVLFALSYPFQPIQLSLISVLTVGLPSFFLALEPNRRRISGNFLKNVFSNALPGAICVFICAIVSGVVGPRYALSYFEVNTLCVYLTGTACLFVLFRVCLPLDRWRMVLFCCMTALFFTSALLFPGFFRMILPKNTAIFVMYAIMAIGLYPLLLLLTKLIKRLLRT